MQLCPKIQDSEAKMLLYDFCLIFISYDKLYHMSAVFVLNTSANVILYNSSENRKLILL